MPVSGAESAQDATRAANPDRKTPLAPRKRCNGCERDLPADAFTRGHSRCRECRARYEARRMRERRAQAAQADEEPHPAPTPQRGRKGARRLASDRYWAERRRTLIEQARRNGASTEERDGRTFTVLHLAAQYQP
jgi:hypothetical protein